MLLFSDELTNDKASQILKNTLKNSINKPPLSSFLENHFIELCNQNVSIIM